MAETTNESKSLDQMISNMGLGPGTDFFPDREVSMPMPKRHVSSDIFSYISGYAGDSRLVQLSDKFQDDQAISAPTGNNFRFNDGSSSMASSQIDSFYNSQTPPCGVRAFSMTDFGDGETRSKFKFADSSVKSDEMQIKDSSLSDFFASNHLVKHEPRLAESMGLGESSFLGGGARIIYRSQSAPLMESATWPQQVGQGGGGSAQYHLSLSRPQNSQAHMMQAQISSGQFDSQMEPSYTLYTGVVPSQALRQQLCNANDRASMFHNSESMQGHRNEYPGGGVEPAGSLPANLKSHLQDLDKRLEIRRGKVSGTTATAITSSGYSHQPHNPSAQLGREQQKQQQYQYQTGGRVQNLRAYATPSPSLESYVYFRNHSGKNFSSSLGPPASSPSFNLSSLEDSSVEDIVCKTCKEILIEAANNTLKAVELANTLRARVGTEVLAQVRERWGGLLALLERRSQVFRVERIPKNDLVSLISADQIAAASGGMLLQGSDFSRRNPTTSEIATVFAQPSFSIATAAPVASRVGQYLSMTAPYARQASPGLVDSVFHPGSVTLGRSGSAGTASSPSPPLFLTEGGHSANPNANPSRCLHVGNVPPHLSESQLWAEFQQYGDVDGLKVVTQRNRRFAFVNYTTLEQAISAKQQMSKIQLWKSAISFAHKESYSGLISKGSTPSPGPPSRLSSASPRPEIGTLTKNTSDSTSMLHGDSNYAFANIFQQKHGRSSADGGPSLAMPVPVPGPVLRIEHAVAWYPSSSSHTLQPHEQLDVEDTDGHNASSIYQSFSPVGNSTLPGQSSQSLFPNPNQNLRDFPDYRQEHQHQHQQQPMLQTLMRPASVDVFAYPQPQQGVSVQAQQRSQSAMTSSPSPHPLLVNCNNSHNLHPLQLAKHNFSSPDSSATSSPLQGQSPRHSPSQALSRLGSSAPAILRRLCDDTYVPTQLWPVDATADAPFCSAVISQLRQFGGATTISKLRGFLRNRLAATDNIKSVPLKALLSAYPHFFAVNGNQVALASSSGISPLLSSPSSSQNRQRANSGGGSGNKMLVGVIAEPEAAGELHGVFSDRFGSALEDDDEGYLRRRAVEHGGGRRYSDGEGVSLLQFGMSDGCLHSPSVSLNYSLSSRSLNSDTSSDSRGGGGGGGGRTSSLNSNPSEFQFAVNGSPLLQLQQHHGSGVPSYFSQQPSD